MKHFRLPTTCKPFLNWQQKKEKERALSVSCQKFYTNNFQFQFPINRNNEQVVAAQFARLLQAAVQAGQVKIPPGYHPIDVEKEWGRLHVAILERERLLRTEFERYAG